MGEAPLGRAPAAIAALLLAAAMAGGCASQPEGAGEVIDPTKAAVDMGTLVDISDVLEISQRMVDSLRRSPELDALLKERRPVLIAVEPSQIKNLTSMTNFSKMLFVNQLAAAIDRTAGQDFKLLARESVAAERNRQLAGEVKTSGVDAVPAGAELVLSGRILEKLDRKPARDGSVEETRSVQFSFNLVRVKDAVTLWSDAWYRVKQQVIGTVYS
jgi:hypothetical protein